MFVLRSGINNRHRKTLYPCRPFDSAVCHAGSWGCFDEFNRLVPEVLSVCSVQYKCVTDAQRRKASLPGRGLEYVDADGGKHQVMSFLVTGET
jgi:hypothetical protein